MLTRRDWAVDTVLCFRSPGKGKGVSLSRVWNVGVSWLNRMEPVERRFASFSALGRRCRGRGIVGISPARSIERCGVGVCVGGMRFGGTAGRGRSFLFRSSSSSSISLINNSKLAMDKSGGGGAGQGFDVGRAGRGRMVAGAGDEGREESFTAMLETLDFVDTLPPSRC